MLIYLNWGIRHSGIEDSNLMEFDDSNLKVLRLPFKYFWWKQFNWTDVSNWMVLGILIYWNWGFWFKGTGDADLLEEKRPN